MSNKPPEMPKDYEEMDFTIEHESWNEYELKDGAKIKGRILLLKIIRDPYKPNEYKFNLSQPMWSVYAPSHMRGEPNVKREGPKILGEKYEVQPLTNNEPWNVYRITKTGQKLKIKITVTEISRFKDVYDNGGIPVYDVPSGAAISLTGTEPTKGP